MDESIFEIVRPETGPASEHVVIVRAVQTCLGCPSQWDAWDAEGRYFYLRHRQGRGSVDHFPSADVETWGTAPLGSVSSFRAELPIKGELQAFCDAAGITLAPDAKVTGYSSYIEERHAVAD